MSPNTAPSLAPVVLLLSCWLGWCGAAVAQPRVHYVSAVGTGDGSSWAEATPDLRAALARARSGDEVWVAAGTYAPASCHPCDATDRATSFALPAGVRLRGGFRGDEATLDERPTPLAAAVLSGRIDTLGDTQSMTILTVVAPTAGTLVEGFAFRGGRADDAGGGLANAGVSGAHIDVTAPHRGDSLAFAVARCRFDSAYAKGYGGAVFVDANDGRHARIRFEACDFANNRSRVGGGAVYLGTDGGGTDACAFVDCGFRQNTAGADGSGDGGSGDGGSGAEGGGAILVSARDGGRTDARITGGHFDGNDAHGGDGGAIRTVGIGGHVELTVARATFVRNRGKAGGAVEFDARFGGRGAPHFTDVRFAYNHADNGGGAFYLDANGGGESHPTFERCAVVDNRSEESGGGLYFNGFDGVTRPLLRDTRIERNSTRFYGGGVYNFGRGGVASPTLVNVLLARNRASSAGGMYCLGSLGGESSPVVVHSAFVNNVAEVGGALYSNASDETGEAAATVVNTVFQGNRAALGPTLRNVLGRPTLRHCSFDLPDCEALRSGTGEQHDCLGGNRFAVADVFRDTARQDYRLRPGAPVVDAGAAEGLPAANPPRDATGGDRVLGAAPDIGPLELDSAAVPAGPRIGDYLAPCPSEDLRLRLEGLPDYPLDIAWRRDGSVLSEADTFSIVDIGPADGQAYVVTVGGWTGVDTIAFVPEIAPAVETSLAVEMPAADTLFVGGTYEWRAVALPAANVDRLRWTVDRPATGVDTAAVAYRFSPADTGAVTLVLEATYTGRCLDTAVRRRVVRFGVSPLGSGVVAALAQGGFRVLGNPVRDVLRVGRLEPAGSRPNGAAPVTATLYSADGRTVARARLSDGDDGLATGGLPAGVYVLRLDAADGSYAGLVVKR